MRHPDSLTREKQVQGGLTMEAYFDSLVAFPIKKNVAPSHSGLYPILLEIPSSSFREEGRQRGKERRRKQTNLLPSPGTMEGPLPIKGICLGCYHLLLLLS